MDDDFIIAATPESGSDYASFVTNPVTFSFNAVEFEKAQVYVEVVCFEPDEYELFGFNWFVAEEIMIREQCFFGDICVSDPDDYIGSLYENQSAGLQIDMPAIFKIEVWRNGEQTGVYGNEEWLGEGQPTCVLYGDYLHYTDVFEFKLFILVKVGTGFDYVHFQTWTFEDDEEIEQGTDGIVDFVLGSCFPDADWVFPAYMNLPLTVTYKIIEAAPGDLGGYVDAKLSDIPAGYDIFNGVWASWCFDHQTSIIMNWPYSMNVYNSLYPDQLPVYTATDNWDNANWLMNHLDWYSGYEWYDIQGALWLMDDPQWNGGAMAGVPALADMVWVLGTGVLGYWVLGYWVLGTGVLGQVTGCRRHVTCNLHPVTYRFSSPAHMFRYLNFTINPISITRKTLCTSGWETLKEAPTDPFIPKY